MNLPIFSHFVLIADFEQAHVCWVNIEKANTFEGKIRYVIRYVIIVSVRAKFINK